MRHFVICISTVQSLSNSVVHFSMYVEKHVISFLTLDTEKLQECKIPLQNSYVLILHSRQQNLCQNITVKLIFGRNILFGTFGQKTVTSGNQNPKLIFLLESIRITLIIESRLPLRENMYGIPSIQVPNLSQERLPPFYNRSWYQIK